MGLWVSLVLCEPLKGGKSFKSRFTWPRSTAFPDCVSDLISIGMGPTQRCWQTKCKNLYSWAYWKRKQGKFPTDIARIYTKLTNLLSIISMKKSRLLGRIKR